MSAPDPKAVDAAIAEAENALLDERRLTAGILITLIDAARAYLRTPTAPQGAEIAREVPRSAHPDVVRLLREFHLDAMGRGHDPHHALTKLMVSGYMQKRGPEVIAALAAHDRMVAEVSAAIDAALTPTDAETKHDD